MLNLEELNKLSQKIIGCAIEVHRRLGPGLLESIYEKALCIGLEEKGLKFEQQKIIPLNYKGRLIGEFRVDIVVENKVVVELKSVERHDPIFDAQILSYMKLGNYKLGLLINFNTSSLKNAIVRIVNDL